MKKFYIYLVIAVSAMLFPSQTKAATWTYDFENIESLINNEGPRKAIDANFNGLMWHMYGAKRNIDDMDWCNGEGSICLNGTLLNSSILATETPNITLTTSRSIGTFEFYAAAHDYWKNNQIWWIVQYSTDGNNWITTGDAFMVGPEPELIVRKVNQPKAQVRIVREDYATYDYTSGTAYENKINFDDFKITDYDGTTAPILSADVSSLDFGELLKGEEATRSFTLTHKNIEGDVKMEIIGDDAVYFTLLTEAVSEGESTEISIKCTGKRKGDYKAVFRATADDIQFNLTMTAVGKIDDNVLFSGGTGTEEDPYLISDASDMQTLSKMVEDEQNTFEGQYFLMTNDINMSSIANFRSIGNQFGRQDSGIDGIRPFSGTFDGGNHVLRNVTISNSYNFVGVFGIVNGATIKNLTISNSSFFASSGVAPLIGEILEYAVVQNCHVTSDVVVSNEMMYASGLIAGAMEYLGAPAGKCVRISDCTTAARVTDFTGGASGIICSQSAKGAIIERCGNMAEVTSQNHHVAGICMKVRNTTTISDCYNTGKLFMQDQNSHGGEIQTNCCGGGIVATAADILYTDQYLTIENCYTAGYLSESSTRLHVIYNADELYGENYIMTNNYYDAEKGNIYEKYATAVEKNVMKSETFVNLLNNNEEGCWTIIAGKNDGFPVPESGNVDAIKTTKTVGEPVVSFENGNMTVSGNYDRVTVYDINGQQHSTNSLSNGVYIIKIEAEGKTYTKKVLR